MADNPRRVAEVLVEIDFAKNYTERERSILEHAARTCPVLLSLHSDLKKDLRFNYPA
jgi:hypothetical protein